MLCENCKKNLATAFSSVFIDGVLHELYLCGKCLDKKQTSLINIRAEDFENLNGKICVCGTSFNEIAQSGFVKCKHCYSTFKEQLKPIILKLHAKNRHTGKRKLSKLELLLDKLEKAKKSNFFSLAQKIEKEILALKGELNEEF